MRIVPMKTLMKKARKSGYAVPAFNCCNMEMIKGVLETANEMRSPVILGIHPVEVAYFGSPHVAVVIAKTVGEKLDIDVAIHLDHGDSPEAAAWAIRGGFSSVMYDGSHLPLAQNIANSRKVVKLAAKTGTTVEGEVGTIGMTDEFGAKLEDAHLSDPDAAEQLAVTGIDCLAVAIGNAHGFYVEEPKLRFDLVEEITRRVKIPLVLHGGTGIPRDQVQKAISMGVAKMNVGTAIRYAFVSAVKKTCETEPAKDLGLMTLGKAGMENMSSAVREYIGICMSGGRMD